jgi:hypothetical protein
MLSLPHRSALDTRLATFREQEAVWGRDVEGPVALPPPAFRYNFRDGRFGDVFGVRCMRGMGCEAEFRLGSICQRGVTESGRKPPVRFRGVPGIEANVR